MVREWKSRRIEKILISFLFFLFGWEWKSEKMEKVRLYEFTHVPLLKMMPIKTKKSDQKKKKNTKESKEKEKKKKEYEQCT